MNVISNSATSNTEKIESRFICFLSNVTDNITKIHFGPNTSVRRISRREIIRTLEESEDLPSDEVEWQIDHDMRLCNYRKDYGYVVETQKTWERSRSEEYSYWDDPFNWFYHDINQKIEALRLMKDG